MIETDLFGNEVIKDVLLRDKYIEPPFSVLDTKSGSWVMRKNQWKRIGIKSEIGRDAKVFGKFTPSKGDPNRFDDISISIFDPALCEVLYRWFVPDGGKILDPFAGGSVRGIVANYLGYNYTGIDIRKEQVESNYEQANAILPCNVPKWLVGDSNIVLDVIDDTFDFIFSCPPYANLEVYSDLDGDISNMNYIEFLSAYTSIIKKSCNHLRQGGLACFVIGEIRDKNGNYIGFIPDTINAFKNANMVYYNEAILLDQLGSAAMRSNGNMSSKKLVKVHQNVLIFKKL